MTDKNIFSFCHVEGRLEYFESAEGMATVLGNYQYVISIVKAIDHFATAAGVHIVVTWWNNVVPRLTPGFSVLIVLGEERGQVPMRADTADLIFRTGSPKTPWRVLQIRQRPFSLLVLSSIREFRNVGLRVRRWLGRATPLGTPGHLDSIPIGFVGNTELEPVEMPARQWEVSFAGGAGTHRMVRGGRWPLCAKSAARLAMWQATGEIKSAWPDLRMQIIFPDMQPQAALSKADYYRLLQQTKISLCPRGNFPETFRLFESARMGCAIITDVLPKCWYFENHPFIEVNDWRKIAPLIKSLVEDAPALQELGHRSRKWWDEVASPEAVGRKIARKIQSRRTESQNSTGSGN